MNLKFIQTFLRFLHDNDNSKLKDNEMPMHHKIVRTYIGSVILLCRFQITIKRGAFMGRSFTDGRQPHGLVAL